MITALVQKVSLWLLLAGIWSTQLFSATEPLGPSSRRTGLAISEIMYHPAPRSDGKNLEFLEVFNSQLWFEDISGYRLSGAVDFTFPEGTVLPARAFLIVAKAPAEVRSIYGITNVTGPYRNSLPNGSGTLRLHHRNGGVLLEVTYSDDPPWPVAPDGAGHSLVLGRPSYGENHSEAWVASEQIGGSPGGFNTARLSPLRPIVINEFLIGEAAYIELYNHSNQVVDLSGCIITADPLTNKFALPRGTLVGAGGFVPLIQKDLGFFLSSAGGTLYLKSPDQTRVLDAVRYAAQTIGVACGRSPDGAPSFRELRGGTPGAPNSASWARDIVINEIMYAPITGDSDDEYVELYNQGTNAVDLSSWRLVAGIEFTFPANTVLRPDAYLVVAKNAERLRTNYSNLNAFNTVGDFKGRLSNNGQRLALERPEKVVALDPNQPTATNTLYIVADEVTYSTGGRWGKWSDEGGSSLELIDPRSDHRLASNWADSDESGKSQWTVVETRGVLDNGIGAADSLQVLLMGIGECLIDNVEVIGPGNTNRISNSTFNNGLTGWVLQGSFVQSSLESTGGVDGSPCLHIRATHRGDTGANRIRTKLTSSLSVNSTATLRARARWLRGFPEMLLRLRGNYLEAPAVLSLPKNLGTPGARNSRAVRNAGPALYEVKHHPVLPATNQAVVVTARVHDPDGLASLSLRYRVDPSTNITAVPLADDGANGDEIARDGIFSGRIPGQTNGAIVAFHIQATDGFTPPAVTRFPSEAPVRECLVRFGEPSAPGAFGAYRFWLTKTNFDTWSRRLKLSNEPIDATFTYGDERVIYNIGALYSGSPYHSPSYSTPTGSLCNYILLLPEDDRLLGVTDFKLTAPGNNPGDDDTAQREQTAYWLAAQLGLPYNYQRNIYLFVNGVRRGRIFEDTQIPNSEVLEEWFPQDADGELYKIAGWFEFDDAASTFQTTWATLQNFTSGGRKKLARYRWNWQRRAADLSTSNYTNLIALVDAVNAPAAAYTASVESRLDVDQWVRTFAVEHIAGNWDSYGNNNGQNMFAYKPTQGLWQLLIWDFDIVLGLSSDAPTTSLFKAVDPTMVRLTSHPPFRRAYWRALREAAYGPLQNATLNALLDAKYAAFRTNGALVTSPSAIKSFLTSRRNYILQQLRSVTADFVVTTSQGDDFRTNQNSITLTGSAPVEVETIQVNGAEYPVAWTTVTNWSITVPLRTGVNTLAFEGRDHKRNLLTNSTTTLNVTYTGPDATPPDHVVINEWLASNTKTLANPWDGEFGDWFELYNPTPNFVDLAGYALSETLTNSVMFVIPAGTVISPHEYLLVWADRKTEQNGPGRDLHVNFRLNQSGDAIALFSPDGKLVDFVQFRAQSSDISEGRWPDGHTPLFRSLPAPSPRASNTLINASVDAIRLTQITASTNGTLLAWEAQAGKRYHVQFKNRIEESAWHNLAGDIIASDVTASKLDATANSASERFYRIQLVR